MSRPISGMCTRVVATQRTWQIRPVAIDRAERAIPSLEPLGQRRDVLCRIAALSQRAHVGGRHLHGVKPR